VRNYLRTLVTRDAGTQMMRLAMIGVLNTITYFVLFNIARAIDVSLFWSVTIAFGLSTFMSYVLNRRWTFGLDDNSGGVTETAQFFAVNIMAWGVTVLIVMGADRLFGPLGILGENLASLAAAALILVPKFASYRDVVFRKALHRDAAGIARE
jgi:putative flippase GtrA